MSLSEKMSMYQKASSFWFRWFSRPIPRPPCDWLSSPHWSGLVCPTRKEANTGKSGHSEQVSHDWVVIMGLLTREDVLRLGSSGRQSLTAFLKLLPLPPTPFHHFILVSSPLLLPGWMASLTQWTGVWACSRRWWRKGRPGMLSPWGGKGHVWATEQEQKKKEKQGHRTFLNL